MNWCVRTKYTWFISLIGLALFRTFKMLCMSRMFACLWMCAMRLYIAIETVALDAQPIARIYSLQHLHKYHINGYKTYDNNSRKMKIESNKVNIKQTLLYATIDERHDVLSWTLWMTECHCDQNLLFLPKLKGHTRHYNDTICSLSSN